MAIDTQILSRLNSSESELLGLLRDDVSEIFSTMLGREISPCPLLADLDTRFKNCVTAIICMSGSYVGAVSVHATPVAAMEITSWMLEMPINSVSADVTDAMGEITNMVAGSFKHHFVTGGRDVRLTPPTVTAVNERFRSPDSLPDMLALMFEAGSDHILVTVNLEIWD